MTVEQYQALIGEEYLNNDGTIRKIASVHIYIGNVISAQVYTETYKFEPFSADRLVKKWREAE